MHMHTCLCALCVCVCVCMCVGAMCEELIQYYDYKIIIFEVLMYTFFVDLVKCDVLILVSEIWCYINDRYYYY